MVDDLADRVYDALAEFAADDAMSGFTVHRGSDGTAAVTFRSGAVPAYAYVLRQTLMPWAERLRERGFAVEVQLRDDRGEKDVPQWLKITGYQLVAGPADGAAA
jgi:hypothetical protein